MKDTGDNFVIFGNALTVVHDFAGCAYVMATGVLLAVVCTSAPNSSPHFVTPVTTWRNGSAHDLCP